MIINISNGVMAFFDHNNNNNHNNLICKVPECQKTSVAYLSALLVNFCFFLNLGF